MGRELGAFGDVLRSSTELVEVLDNPGYPASARKAIVEDITKRLEISSLTQRFLAVAVDKGRITHMGDIARAYTKLADARQGQLRVDVMSPDTLDEKTKETLRQTLESMLKQKVILQTEHDSELVAGSVIRIGSMVYDSSLRTRLETMKQQLIAGQS